MQTSVIPQIEGLVSVNIAALKLALEKLALIWETVLKPAIEKVWQFLQDHVIPKFVDLKAKLDGPVTSALNSIRLVFDKVANAISSISGAIQDVLGWLSDLINTATNALNLLRELGGGGDHGMVRGGAQGGAAAGMAAEAKGIADALLALVNAFTAVAKYRPEQIGATLNVLFDQFRGVVFKLEQLSQLISDKALGYATTLAEAGGKIVGQLKGMVDGFTAVAGYQPQKIGPTLNILFDQLQGVIFKLQRVAGLVDAAGLPAAVTLAEAGGKIIGQLKGMVDGFTAVAEYKAGQIGPTLNILFDQLRETVGLMVKAAGAFDAVLVEAGAVFAQTAGRITGPLSSIIDALNAVAGYGQAGRVNFAARIGQLMTDLQATAAGIVFGLRGFGKDVLASLEDAAATSEALARLVDFVESTAGALNTVAGYGQAGRVNFGARIGQLMADLRATATGIVFGLRGFGRDVLASLEDTAATSEALGRLVAFVDGTAGSLNAVAVYGQAGRVNFAARTGQLMADLRATATGIVTALREFGRDVLASLEDAATTTDALGRLVAFVDATVGALNTVAGYASAADLAARVRAFATDAVTMAIALQQGLGGLSDPLAAAFDEAIAFGQRIAAIVGVIRPGMDAIAAVVTYKRGTVDLRAAVQLFVADAILVAETLRDGLGSPAQALLDAYDAALTFAERITAVLGFVRPALEMLREIERYGGAGNLHTGTLNFLRHIEGLINALATTFAALGPETVRSAAEFSTLIRTLVTNMTGAMRDLAGLGDVQALVDAAFGVGSSWIDGLIDGLTSRLSDLTALMAYIRGLFPSSPARYGAWRTLPDGAAVGSAFTGGMTGELARGERGVNAAMARLHSALGAAGGGGRGGAAGGTGGGTAVTINFQQPVVVREDADIQRLAQAVGDVLARQASTNKRMTAAWATAART
ncbi:MAG: hypothetical protein IPK78_18130 [Rhodospirillales bacterium]|nr:hypothetical protein [Rhodospirillales bacterium]